MNTKLNNEQDWREQAQQANWSVAKLAKLCDVSESTLLRHFHQHVGKTFRDWLAEQRFKQALESRRDGSSIKEIAAQLGYRHPQTFAREFKKHWANRPQNYWISRSGPFPKPK